jgi:hypothetical protein
MVITNILELYPQYSMIIAVQPIHPHERRYSWKLLDGQLVTSLPNPLKNKAVPMIAFIRRLLAICVLSTLYIVSDAQPVESSTSKEPKPYRVSTSGKQITVKSTKNIHTVMLWTSDGNRVLEQREINNNSCTFTLPVNNRLYFLMVTLAGGKVYTEKIGVR